MSLVGSLMYLATVSQPDIAYAISQAGQKMNNPSKDWKNAKRILRYLKGIPVPRTEIHCYQK